VLVEMWIACGERMAANPSGPSATAASASSSGSEVTATSAWEARRRAGAEAICARRRFTVHSYLTPTELFYIRSHFPAPKLDLAGYRLRIAPHWRDRSTPPTCKNGSRVFEDWLANAGQLTVNRGLIFTMSLESLLDLRRPAVHCTRQPPRRERMACRFRPVDRNASAVLHIEKHLFSRARGDKNSGNEQGISDKSFLS
jgi:hypothetical protein